MKGKNALKPTGFREGIMYEPVLRCAVGAMSTLTFVLPNGERAALCLQGVYADTTEQNPLAVAPWVVFTLEGSDLKGCRLLRANLSSGQTDDLTPENREGRQRIEVPAKKGVPVCLKIPNGPSVDLFDVLGSVDGGHPFFVFRVRCLPEGVLPLGVVLEKPAELVPSGPFEGSKRGTGLVG